MYAVSFTGVATGLATYTAVEAASTATSNSTSSEASPAVNVALTLIVVAASGKVITNLPLSTTAHVPSTTSQAIDTFV